MKKLNTSPISGMQELLPLDQALFNNNKKIVEEVFRMHAFLEVETPTIDRTEILLAKAGGETEKQIYRVFKTEETADSADQALRFDHTVPLARYVAEHESDLAFPFKATQLGRNFRGERAQKGRFREFYQADIDVVGRNSLPIFYDAEVILTLGEALQEVLLDYDIPFTIRISNRKILAGFIEDRNLQEVSDEIFAIIDHAEKVPVAKTREALTELKIGDERVSEIMRLMNISGDLEDVAALLKQFPCDSELFNKGCEELCTVLAFVEDACPQQGLTMEVIADMKIVRGLDYYTGTVFETNLTNHKEVGSICSGGRYENLCNLFSDQKFPGVGGSIGLTRLFYVLNEKLLIPEDERFNPIGIVLIPFSEVETLDTLTVAAIMRRRPGAIAPIDVLLDTSKKLGDRIKYASKIAQKIAVVGPDELENRSLRLKDLTSGDEMTVYF